MLSLRYPFLEPDPELDGLTWDELEEVMYESIYKPSVTKMHVLAAELKCDFTKRMEKLTEISRRLDATRIDLDLQRQINVVKSYEILARNTFTHAGSLTGGAQGDTSHSASKMTQKSAPISLATKTGVGGSVQRQQQRTQRKPMIDVRMPSIVKDTRFTKLTPLKINQTVGRLKFS